MSTVTTATSAETVYEDALDGFEADEEGDDGHVLPISSNSRLSLNSKPFRTMAVMLRACMESDES